MEITKDIIKESSILNEGTTCYIMQYKNTMVYKLYRGALEYIIGNGEYSLNESETLNRLNYIISKRKDITLTDLPLDTLTYNGKPAGVVINYYKNSIPLKEYLRENLEEVNISLIKQQIVNIVEELIKNGIIPTDPHFGNFLLCYNEGTYKLSMIDTDDQYISIYPDNKKDVWYESEVEACYRVIDLSFEELFKNKKIK